MAGKTATIDFACGNCGRKFSVPASFAGRKASCKTCATAVVVPALSGSATTSVSPMEPTAAARNNPRPAPSLAATRNVKPVIPASVERNPVPAAASAVARPSVPPAPPVPMRLRRLRSDAMSMSRVFEASPLIHVTPGPGDPPDLYRIEYSVESLERGKNGKPVPRAKHVVEIQLTSDYPRLSPKCTMVTPIFHPNIDDVTICVGDHWTAGERLVDLVVRIAEMIAYQAYNIKSPLNGEAAMWADLNAERLPIDARSFRPESL